MFDLDLSRWLCKIRFIQQPRSDAMSDSYAGQFENNSGVNSSNNPQAEFMRVSRRHLLGGVATTLAVMSGSIGAVHAAALGPKTKGTPLGFTAVPTSTADMVVVPPEYEAQVLFSWGDPVGSVEGAPSFKQDASNSWQEQSLQSGMHHDGMEYFPLSANGNRGLLAINHEYTDDGLLHTDGMKTWNATKVRKSQEAHGVSIIEVERKATRWQVVQKSRYARRITASSMMAISGPAATSALMKTSYDPSGTKVLGTLNNCAAGKTPWGTYLTCEENWHGYFSAGTQLTEDQKRYGLRPKGWGYQWHEFDTRFDTTVEPNEANRFGWVVEIDPKDPSKTPVKRTALGRFKHEGAFCTVSEDGRAVVYMGDDERFEYIYKFVSSEKIKPGGYAFNQAILDSGKLYVAQFNSNGVGSWLELSQGLNGLTEQAGFQTQADVVVKCRQAADIAGATKMDRPEWIAVHPSTKEVFVTLTNNALRGQAGRPANEQPNDPNPRSDNQMGHIVRWQEGGSDAAATSFRWMFFALAGDPKAEKPEHQGTINGDAYAAPDGLSFDKNGLLWIQTDMSTSAMHKGPLKNLGNNVMLVADPATGLTKRFLTGPSGCEVTGISFAPDHRSLFVNIQHPGETPSERSDPNQPTLVSRWPDADKAGRPRSATLVIRRKDGGVVGT
jgi:secreted PhoX family phosphatase